MKNTTILLLIILTGALTSCTKSAKEVDTTDSNVQLAATPPMGWNSYNTFGIDINAQIVMDVADAMVEKGMLAAGYEYVVIDDGWQIARDENGKIIADSARFPKGIKFVADYVHSKGLKFGIYTDMGTMTCGQLPGSYGYEEIDAQTYAEWGVDFVKADWCFTDGLDTRTQYKILSDAMRATGRSMVLSICEWGTTSPWEWGAGIGEMWRSTNDIQDCFDCVRDWGGMGWVPILEKNVNLAPYAGPSHWNDPDMLEVGNKSLNLTESKAHFSMWCMLAAPLIAGNDIATMNDSVQAILTAPEIIAIDQDPLGKQGTRIKNENGLQVWQKPLTDGSIAVALLNVSSVDAQMSFSLEEIGLQKGENQIRDLWARKDLPSIDEKFETNVVAHGVVVVKVKGMKAAVSKLAFNEESIKLNVGNHEMIEVTVVPSITPVLVSSSQEEVFSVEVAGVNLYRIKAKSEGKANLMAATFDGQFTVSIEVIVSASDLPDPWKFDDINDDKASVFYENGVFTVKAAGADIWAGFDQFAFVNQKKTGDAYISARIISQENTHPWAKAGLMFRESTAPNSKFMLISVTPGNGISMQWREKSGEGCLKKDFEKTDLPTYLKLAKSGSSFKSYLSNDGQSWKLMGEVTLDFANQYLVGLEVASHSSQVLNTSTFDQVEISK
jgi:alpha-galactosidase